MHLSSDCPLYAMGMSYHFPSLSFLLKKLKLILIYCGNVSSLEWELIKHTFNYFNYDNNLCVNRRNLQPIDSYASPIRQTRRPLLLFINLFCCNTFFFYFLGATISSAILSGSNSSDFTADQVRLSIFASFPNLWVIKWVRNRISISKSRNSRETLQKLIWKDKELGYYIKTA